MKRLFGSLVAGAALFTASLAFAPAASAATPITTHTNGGVTCSQYLVGNGTAYPETYWDCVNPSNPTTLEQDAAGIVVNLATAHNNVISTISNVQIYLFANNTAFANYFGVTTPPSNAFGAITTNVAAAFSTATINGQAVDLTPDYGTDLVQELGQQFYQLSGTTYSASTSTFTAAYQYDQKVSGTCSAGSWPTGWCSGTQTNWQVFANYYLSDEQSMFGYEFAAAVGDNTYNPPNAALRTYFPNTKGIELNYVFGPINNAAVVHGSVLCAQQHNSLTFPSSWWDCVNPYSPDSYDTGAVSEAASLGNSTFETDLASMNIGFYVMNSAADYNIFFGGNISTAVEGWSNLGNSTAIFRNETSVSLLSYMKAITAHELAHQLAYYWNNVDTNPNSNFTKAYNADVTIMKGKTCSQVWGTTQDPFTGEEVCSEWTGNAYQIMQQMTGYDNSEGFADSFQYKTGQFAEPIYQQYETYLTNLQSYMNGVVSSGTAN